MALLADVVRIDCPLCIGDQWACIFTF